MIELSVFDEIPSIFGFYRMRFIHKVRRLTTPFHRLVSRWFGLSVFAGGVPRGIFKEVEAIHNQTVVGAVVLDGQALAALPHHSEIRAAGLKQDEYSQWRGVWTRRENCFLAAPSLAHLDTSGRVCLEAIYGPHGITDPVWRRKRPYPLRRLSGDFTSIISRWNMGDNYFHWFMDGLTRLSHLERFPASCRILVPRGLPPYAKRSLEILGLEDRLEETAGEDLQIERYWFAGPTMISGCPDPAGVVWLRKNLGQQPSTRPNKLLYLDRNAATRNCTNAAELRKYFAQRGWTVVDAGTMSLDEQMQLFSEARGIVSVHGAALTNLLWMPSEGRVLELMPSKRRNGCYAGLAMAAGLQHQDWVLNSDRQGRMHVPLHALEPRLLWVEALL
jgi:capsular polysaccharide biosynthesis protein